MDAPTTIADIVWIALSGAIFICVAACALLLKILLEKISDISLDIKSISSNQAMIDRAIVEIQTRCAINHGHNFTQLTPPPN